jgi:5'(3')-deoxyribonucleotidase
MGVRKYLDIPRIYLDMDGPLADFDRAIIETGTPGNVLKLQPGVFRNLKVVPGAKSAVARLRALAVDVWIMTKSPDGSTLAASEKQAWQQEHFPELRDHIIITPDKGCVGRECDFLVDDHPEWANARNFPGTVIKFIPVYDTDGESSNNWNEIVERLRAIF